MITYYLSQIRSADYGLQTRRWYNMAQALLHDRTDIPDIYHEKIIRMELKRLISFIDQATCIWDTEFKIVPWTAILAKKVASASTSQFFLYEYLSKYQ